MEEEDEGEIATAGGIHKCRGLDTDDTGDTGVSVNRSEFQ